MAPASADPQPPSHGEDIDRPTERAQYRQAGERHERHGPLDIARHVKDDGRALIIYTRREPEGT